MKEKEKIMEDNREIIFWCLYCKNPIYEGQKYVVDENGEKLHKECDDLMTDNSDYFAI